MLNSEQEAQECDATDDDSSTEAGQIKKMNMKKDLTQLVDEHLQSFTGLQEATTDDFFYTRLKGRMQKAEPRQGWSLPLKPVWVISTLVLLLAVNGFMLSQQVKTKATVTTISGKSSLQNFAESYDQTISSY